MRWGRWTKRIFPGWRSYFRGGAFGEGGTHFSGPLGCLVFGGRCGLEFERFFLGWAGRKRLEMSRDICRLKLTYWFDGNRNLMDSRYYFCISNH